MKKILTAVCLLLSLAHARTRAQTFTLHADTVREAYANRNIELHNDIKNTADSTIRVKWKVIAANSDFPQSWISAAAVCDNSACYSNSGSNLMSGVTIISDPIRPDSSAIYFLYIPTMQGLPDGSHVLTTQLNNGSTQRYSVFRVSKAPLGIPVVSRTDDEVLLYPSPAHNELNVHFSSSLGVRNVMVYNLIGRMVASKKTNDDKAQLDLSDMPSGVYFVRLANGNGNVVATRRFIRQ